MKKWITLLLIAAVFALADTIKFKNGAVVEGKITQETSQIVTIKVGDTETTYAKADIAFITRGGTHISPPPPPPVKSGSKASASSSKNATRSIVLRAGTKVYARLDNTIDSRNSRVGQEYRATLQNELVADDGTVVAEQGSPAYVMVADREQAGRMIGHSAIALKLTGITVKGRRVNVQSSVIGVEAKHGQGRDTAKKALVGAGIGALVDSDHKKGARTGAMVGLGAAALTKGEAVTIPAGTVATFTLQSDLKFKVTN